MCQWFLRTVLVTTVEVKDLQCLYTIYIMIIDFEVLTMFRLCLSVSLQLQDTISCGKKELEELVNRRRQEQSEGPQTELEKEVDACAKVCVLHVHVHVHT